MTRRTRRAQYNTMRRPGVARPALTRRIVLRCGTVPIDKPPPPPIELELTTVRVLRPIAISQAQVYGPGLAGTKTRDYRREHYAYRTQPNQHTTKSSIVRHEPPRSL